MATDGSEGTHDQSAPNPGADSPPDPVPNPSRNQDSTAGEIAYETPDDDRPASHAATAHQLDFESPASPEAHDPYAAWRLAPYRLFSASYILAVVGGQMQSVALLWEVYEKTHSPMHLGWIGGIQVLPVILLALPAGQVVDTYSRKSVLLITQLLLLVFSAGLAVLSGFYHTAPWFLHALYALVFLNAVTLTFARPARQSLLPQLVPATAFSNAVTWNSSMFEISSMAGPAIGGIVTYYGPAWAYGANAVMLIACFFLTLRLPVVHHALANGNSGAPPKPWSRPVGFASLLGGVRFVFRSKLMLATMTLDLFAVLLGGATYLLPVFAEKLGIGEVGYGWLRAAPAVGAFSMALIQAHRPPMKRAGRALLLAVAGFGIATIVFGLSNNFWLSFAMLVLTGAFDNISVVVRHTLVQLLTPDVMRGRVSAVNQVFIGSSNELGGLRAGASAAWWGPIASVVVGGIGTLAVVLGVALLFPQIRKFGSLRDAKPEEWTDEDDQRGFEVVVGK